MHEEIFLFRYITRLKIRSHSFKNHAKSFEFSLTQRIPFKLIIESYIAYYKNYPRTKILPHTGINKLTLQQHSKIHHFVRPMAPENLRSKKTFHSYNSVIDELL